MGVVAAHILKDPVKHEGRTYRPTGPEMLTAQEMANIIGSILGRKVTAKKMSEKMFLKSLKALGLPIYGYSQPPHYNEEAFNGAMEVGGPTTVIKDIVGRDPEDFQTIAKRYIVGNPIAKQTVVNKLRAVKNLMKVIFTLVPDLEKYQKEQGHPAIDNMEFSYQNKEWLKEREIQQASSKNENISAVSTG